MEPAISSLVAAADRGDGAASDALFSALYSELHRVARRELARLGAHRGLSPTTLLHQAYLDMAARDGPAFPDHARFMGYAARVMRGLILDHAREQRAQKRGGCFEITSFRTDANEKAVDVVDERELSRISDALDALAKSEPMLAELVDLKFFCGFSFAEIAVMHGVSERTVQRNWQKARIYLHHEVGGTEPTQS